MDGATYPAVLGTSDVRILNNDFPNAMTWEWCPHCEAEVRIPAYRKSTCPECGEAIMPCSMCETCGEVCPYE